MDAFTAIASKPNYTMKLWRGERMCLIGFDVGAPEPDLVGFAIECKPPGAKRFTPLRNRLAFRYDEPIAAAVTGDRAYSSKKAPFQKFRWVHFPFEPKQGLYTYRATKMHMPSDDVLKAGTSITLQISLDPVTYAGFVDVGFTRGFASSQAFRDPKDADIDAIGKTIIPARADQGLAFVKRPGDIYNWDGFESSSPTSACRRRRRVFDHLHFRSTLQDTTGMSGPAKRKALTLRKPRAISGRAASFEAYCVVGSQKMKDRQLFAS